MVVLLAAMTSVDVEPTVAPTMAPLCANANDATVTALTHGTMFASVTSCSQVTASLAATYCPMVALLRTTCPISCSICVGSPTPAPVTTPAKAPISGAAPTAAPTFSPSSVSTASAAADRTGGRGWAQLDAKLALALATLLGALLLAAIIDVIVILAIFVVVSRRRRHARPGAARWNSLAAADAAASTSAWGENGELKMRVYAVELTETRARPSHVTVAL